MCTDYDGDADWVARAVRIIIASPILISCTAEQTTNFVVQVAKLQRRTMHSYMLYGFHHGRKEKCWSELYTKAHLIHD